LKNGRIGGVAMMRFLAIAAAVIVAAGTVTGQEADARKTQIHILHLRKVRAVDVEPAVSELLRGVRARGGPEPLLAVDEGANILVLVADAETRKAVEGVVEKLEQAAEAKADTSMTVAELLTALSKRLDRRFLYSKDLGLHLKRISLQALPDAAPPAELAGLLESILKSHSLFLLPVEGLAGHYTVELSALATKKGLPVLGVDDAVPAGDGMYTKAFKIHGSPRDAQAALINLVTFPQGCVSLEKEGLLVVTDYASNLRKCAKVLDQLH
jgi:hypothetical protein